MSARKLLQTVGLSVAIGFAAASISTAYAGDYCPPEPTAKGNNGWGQEKHGGTDGTNNGSDNGATAPSKTASTER
jgi:hypothetical protein